MSRVLFVLKNRNNYSEFTSYGNNKSSGLANSARFVHEMLVRSGVDSKIVHVTDNNCIDREVHLFKPTHVIIEALWVVPEKFEVLHRLHPHVKWIVRVHSEIPFLANEGMAVEWIKTYAALQNVTIATNSTDAERDLKIAVGWRLSDKIDYLPNYYPIPYPRNSKTRVDGIINVACFGAIRPLKNQLIQAVAAIDFADRRRIKLRFHINCSRKEQGGSSNYRNIEALFEGTKHTLVQHDWMDHHDLLKVLAYMDLSMNVSLSETFNIVAADSVSQGVPVVCSSEVSWTSPFCQALPTSSQDIVRKMETVTDWHTGGAIKLHNYLRLKDFSRRSQSIWLKWLGE